MVARTHHGQTSEDGDRPTRTPESARATTRHLAGRERGRAARARVARRPRPRRRSARRPGVTLGIGLRIALGRPVAVRLAVRGPVGLPDAVTIGIACPVAVPQPIALPHPVAHADADADPGRPRPLAGQGHHAGRHRDLLRSRLRPRGRDEPVRRPGRALAGETSAQILAAYFEGSKPATTSPSQTVRVLLLAGYAAVQTPRSRSTVAAAPGPSTASPAPSRRTAALRAWRTTAKVDGVATTTWRLRVLAADGKTSLYTGKATNPVIVRPATAATHLQLDAKPAASDTYRGSFKVVLNASSASVVDRVGLDNYLRGVVPVEMPPAGRSRPCARRPSPPARTPSAACTRGRARSTSTTTRARRSTAAFEAEKAKTNKVIDDAPGAILKSGKQVVNAFFHSTAAARPRTTSTRSSASTGAVTSSPVKLPARDRGSWRGRRRLRRGRAVLPLDDDVADPSAALGDPPQGRTRTNVGDVSAWTSRIAASRAGCTR